MDSWQKFLDSLATKGGNLLVLIVFVMIFFGSLYLLRGSTNSQVTTVMYSTFSGFAGALLTALTGRQPDQRKTDNGNGNGTTSSTTTSTTTSTTGATVHP